MTNTLGVSSAPLHDLLAVDKVKAWGQGFLRLADTTLHREAWFVSNEDEREPCAQTRTVPPSQRHEHWKRLWSEEDVNSQGLSSAWERYKWDLLSPGVD